MAKRQLAISISLVPVVTLNFVCAFHPCAKVCILAFSFKHIRLHQVQPCHRHQPSTSVCLVYCILRHMLQHLLQLITNMNNFSGVDRNTSATLETCARANIRYHSSHKTNAVNCSVFYATEKTIYIYRFGNIFRQKKNE